MVEQVDARDLKSLVRKNVWVQIPLSAPALLAGHSFHVLFSFLADGKTSGTSERRGLGELAHSVEHLLCKQKVMGSKPIFSTYAVAE